MTSFDVHENGSGSNVSPTRSAEICRWLMRPPPFRGAPFRETASHCQARDREIEGTGADCKSPSSISAPIAPSSDSYCRDRANGIRVPPMSAAPLSHLRVVDLTDL